MTLKFTKMHGLGNDFMVIDAINQTFVPDETRIRQWADRHFGIGFDQLLVVEKSTSDKAEFRYRIFNADGGEVSQCGNGARCFARFVHEHKLTANNPVTVETASGLMSLNQVDQRKVEVNMGVPDFEPAQIPLDTDHRQLSYQIDLPDTSVIFSALSIGNPHAVIVVDDVDKTDVNRLGALLESHPLFPQRVNVGFMQILQQDRFKLRVFERGVGETLACGSGACAAMAAGVTLGLLDHRATAKLQGGQLILEWAGEGQPVMMTGDTAMVYDGELIND